MSQAFNEIVTEAIEYILNHIWDGVTLEGVAEHCHLSVSYFSKMFKDQTGESVYAFIKRVKMEQSALKLKMEQDREITEIGEDFGYSSSNYSSAFSQYHKMSPSRFRKNIQKQAAQCEEIFKEINSKIRVELRPSFEIIYERTIGCYVNMEQAWCQFVEKHKEDINCDTKFFERTYDDPTISDKNRCIYDICMTTNHPEKYSNRSTIPGGKYVVYPYKGYVDGILSLNQNIIGIWFPASGYELDERYSYDQYLMVGRDGYMEFDICIPIK